MLLVDTTKELYDFRCSELREKLDNKLDYFIQVKNYDNFKDICSETDFNALTRAKANRASKRYRNNQKMVKLVDYERYNGSCSVANKVFATATFNDKTLFKKNGDQVQVHTLARKIDKYIKEHYTWAIVNVDYGLKNERIHFHWIGQLKPNEELEEVFDTKTGEINISKKGNDMFELKNKTYQLGFEPTLLIVSEETNELDGYKTITNYLLKINNHSNKDTTKNHRIRIVGDKKYLHDFRFKEAVIRLGKKKFKTE